MEEQEGVQMVRELQESRDMARQLNQAPAMLLDSVRIEDSD
jgi:hypothetical protein